MVIENVGPPRASKLKYRVMSNIISITMVSVKLP